MNFTQHYYKAIAITNKLSSLEIDRLNIRRIRGTYKHIEPLIDSIDIKKWAKH